MQSPISEVIYSGLEAGVAANYDTIAIPTIRMGVMAGAVEKTPQATVAGMSEGINRFLHDYGGEINLKGITFVVYRDPATMKILQEGLSATARSH